MIRLWLQIIRTSDPMTCKRLGRKVANYDESKWVAVRKSVAIKGILAKFQQNPELKTMLLATQKQDIAEASPSDCVWGIGITGHTRGSCRASTKEQCFLHRSN